MRCCCFLLFEGLIAANQHTIIYLQLLVRIIKATLADPKFNSLFDSNFELIKFFIFQMVKRIGRVRFDLLHIRKTDKEATFRDLKQKSLKNMKLLTLPP